MNILNHIGNTPMIQIENPNGKNFANIFIKLEEFNAGGSIKSRVGLRMIEDAECKGMLKKGDTLIEATGGNTGLGLAVACSLKKYKLILSIPDNFSQEKVNVLKKYGAEVVLADHKLGNDCHIITANKILEENNNFINLNQFTNFSNLQAHYYGTGNEILNQLKGKVDYFVSVIGSGGTIVGAGKRIKQYCPNAKIIGVQPKGCDILNDKFIPHNIQAIAVGKVSKFFQKDIIDSMTDVLFDDVQEIREYLAKKEGIFVGLSSGANILAAIELSKTLDNTKNIVTIAPDSGRSYLD